jgi:hypothetical protein
MIHADRTPIPAFAVWRLPSARQSATLGRWDGSLPVSVSVSGPDCQRPHRVIRLMISDACT